MRDWQFFTLLGVICNGFIAVITTAHNPENFFLQHGILIAWLIISTIMQLVSVVMERIDGSS
jgi:hypothetical protein